MKLVDRETERETKRLYVVHYQIILCAERLFASTIQLPKPKAVDPRRSPDLPKRGRERRAAGTIETFSRLEKE